MGAITGISLTGNSGIYGGSVADHAPSALYNWPDDSEKYETVLRLVETSDGGPIGLWENDPFGMTTAIGQVSASSQPTLVVNGINGLESACFDGLDSLLLGQNAGLTGDVDLTLIVVFQADVFGFLTSLYTIGSTNRMFVNLSSGSGQPFVNYGIGNDVFFSGSISTGAPHILAVTKTPGQADLTTRLFVDGVERAITGVPTTVTPNINDAPLGFCTFLDGLAAAGRVYSPALSDSNLSSVTAALKSRYNIP